MTTAEPIRVDVQGHAATVTLQRPEVRNAFDDKTIEALTSAFRSLGQRDHLRSIVLTADGPAFCAGADLNWMKRMAGYSHEENLADAQRLADMLHTICTCPLPVIARIQGDVFAGGMGLVAACDIAVTVTSARFCLSEVNLGLIPATIGPYVLRSMGQRAAQRYVLTGERFNSEEALRIGFVHEACDAATLDSVVERIVQSLANAGPHAVRSAKVFIREIAGADITETLRRRTAHDIAAIRGSAEGIEGVRSFLNQAVPAWREAAESPA